MQQGLDLGRAQQAVGDQLAGGDVGAAQEGSGFGAVDAHGVGVGKHGATAQALQESGRLGCGQAHLGAFGQQAVGAAQQRIALGFGQLGQALQRDGIGQVQTAAGSAAQRAQVGAAAQRLADVLGPRLPSEWHFGDK